MTVITESEAPADGLNSPSQMKTRMLEQMAEALEDQVAGLYRRAAAFEEEEFLLNREVGRAADPDQPADTQAGRDASRPRSGDGKNRIDLA